MNKSISTIKNVLIGNFTLVETLSGGGGPTHARVD